MSSDTIALRLLTGERAEMQELQRVLEEAPTYSHRLTGGPPGRAEAQSLYTALPEGKSYDDKFVFGIYLGEAVIGCVDLIRGYPNAATAMLGLLLLSEKHQRRGAGRRAYALIEQFVQGWNGCDRVRIAVVRSNEDVLPFWTKLAFEPTGQVRPYRCGVVVSEHVALEKRLPKAGTPDRQFACERARKDG